MRAWELKSGSSLPPLLLAEAREAVENFEPSGRDHLHRLRVIQAPAGGNGEALITQRWAVELDGRVVEPIGVRVELTDGHAHCGVVFAELDLHESQHAVELKGDAVPYSVTIDGLHFGSFIHASRTVAAEGVVWTLRFESHLEILGGWGRQPPSTGG